jgi:hypothetical protein
LLVEEADLHQAGARYFIEAHYISADDAAAGNARNNVTYREVKPVLRSGKWVLKNEKPEVRTQPAIAAWKEEGAQLSEIETVEGGAKTYVIIGSKATQMPGGKFRYDYVIYNMNSDLAIQSLSIPATRVDSGSIGFSGGNAGGEIWSNDPWQARIESGRVVWATKTYSEDKNANAIRWGSTYNFWFIAGGGPTAADGTVGRFKVSSAPVSATAVTRVLAPGP